MSSRTIVLLLVLAGFLLGGVVPFSVFLVTGIIYAVGATHQIIVVLAAVIVGGMLFSAVGLSMAKHGAKAGILMLIIPVAASVYVFLHLMAYPVLTLTMLGLYSFFNMSSNASIAFFISGISRKSRGKYLSTGHFISLGTGSPVSFAALFLAYAYLSYSNLPIITLASLVAVFIISGSITATVANSTPDGSKHGKAEA